MGWMWGVMDGIVGDFGKRGVGDFVGGVGGVG
jgi:hypothetical protein